MWSLAFFLLYKLQIVINNGSPDKSGGQLRLTPVRDKNSS